MKTQIVTKPAFHPVSLVTVKKHLRVNHTEEDALLANIVIPAAHRDAANQLGRSIMLTSWIGVLDGFPLRSRSIDLPWPRLQSVQAVQYRDADGATQTLSTDLYGVDLVQSRIYLQPEASWPCTDGTSGCVQITWRAGYSAAADEGAQQVAVPEDVKNWILLRCGSLYEFRELLLAGVQASEIPLGSALLDGEREWGI